MISEIPARLLAVGDMLFQSGNWSTVQSVETTSDGMSVFVKTEIGFVRYGVDTGKYVMRADRVQDVVTDNSSDLAKRITVTVLERAIDVIEAIGPTLPARKRGRADAVAAIQEMIRATEKGR